MIPKNLKVGEAFTDGGYTYKVLEIVKDGYISTRTDIKKKDDPINDIPVVKEETSTPVVEKETSVSGYNKTQINRLPNSKLEEVCKELGIEIGTGTEMKRAIIAKLGL